MENTSSPQLLSNPEQIPDETFLQLTLPNSLFDLYKTLFSLLKDAGLQAEWHYYNDGKAWLCKVCLKKKTMVWISLWEYHFKAGFYFTEKHSEGLLTLDIDEEIKKAFASAKPIGKLIPVLLILEKAGQLYDFEKILRYKMTL